MYLEKQTDSIVQAIQTLLYAMRSSDSFDYQDTVLGINTIVDNLVNVSLKSLREPTARQFRDDGERILRDLSEANERLNTVGKSEDLATNKALKQKLASSSYEIAKFVKELISLLE
jgi:hypothetical protein